MKAEHCGSGLLVLASPGGPEIPCEDDPVCVIIFACVHEHVDRRRACAACAVDIQGCAGFLGCPYCGEGPHAHDCRADVVITWDSGEVTVVRDSNGIGGDG